MGSEYFLIIGFDDDLKGNPIATRLHFNSLIKRYLRYYKEDKNAPKTKRALEQIKREYTDNMKVHIIYTHLTAEDCDYCDAFMFENGKKLSPYCTQCFGLKWDLSFTFWLDGEYENDWDIIMDYLPHRPGFDL